MLEVVERYLRSVVKETIRSSNHNTTDVGGSSSSMIMMVMEYDNNNRFTTMGCSTISATCS